jgi:hypothetical protein
MVDAVTESIQLSAYHFDSSRIDPRFDSLIGVGNFSGNWSDEVANAVKESRPLTMATRSMNHVGDDDYQVHHYYPPKKSKDTEEYDKEKEFFDKTDFGYETAPIVNKSAVFGEKMTRMVNAFKLDPEPISYSCHIQRSGQVFPYHVDFFHRRARFGKGDQKKLIRLMIMLTDWEPGHFFGFGNFQYTHWKAGDVTTFHHAHVPHYSANASYNPRAMILLTGFKTDATEEFLWKMQNSKSINVDEL